MYATTYFNQSAVATANRYQLHVAGINFSDRTDVRLGPLTISLQGPGGQSTMRFTVEQISTGSMAPFRGRAPVFFQDTQSDLKFRGYITHATFRRSQGFKRVIDVDVTGLEKQLDERCVKSFSTRANTSSRALKIDHDDNLVRAVLQYAGMLNMADGGFVQLTNSAMDDMKFNKQTVRSCLDEICDIAQEPADYHLRRYYVDANGQLHYYTGFEGLSAPYRVSEDDRYITTMRNASGIASFWAGKLKDNGDVADQIQPGGNAAPVNGGCVVNTSLCINAPELASLQYNGTTGYLSPSAANLHPGNTGSWGCVFKRRTTGSQQALISGGTDDILIGFDATDHLRVQKEGTGDMFVSTTQYSSTTQVYHLVVTHSPANDTIVYVNGAVIAGAATSRTLVAGSAAINIGRKKSTTDQFYAGRLWGVWVSSSEFSAATAQSQAAVWRSIEPENLVIDRDSTDVTLAAYVTGASNLSPDSAWVYFNDAGDPNFEQVVTNAEGGPLTPQEFLDAPDADTPAKRKKFGHSYMAAKAGTIVSCSFSLSYDPASVPIGGVTTWTPGQTVVITSQDAEGWTAKQLEVKQVDIDLLNASGEVRYDITAGALPYSGLRHIRARSRGMA